MVTDRLPTEAKKAAARGGHNRVAVGWLLLLCCCAHVAGCRGFKPLCGQYDSLPDLSPAAYLGTDVCLLCHQEIYERYQKTAHGWPKKAAAAQPAGGCEACHGPGSLHVEQPGDTALIYGFRELSPRQASAVCLSCHQQAKTFEWLASPHLLAGIACNACHAAHPDTQGDAAHAQGVALCLSCHPEKRAAMVLPSRHPLREGKLSCAACHDSHGAGPKLLKRENANDLCLGCHAEYQGPFVHEHAPVTEDCLICHEPHGTVANALLRQAEPFLCLRCHRAHRNDLEAEFPTNRALLTSCSQCHADVHGSDLPPRHSREGLP